MFAHARPAHVVSEAMGLDQPICRPPSALDLSQVLQPNGRMMSNFAADPGCDYLGLLFIVRGPLVSFSYVAEYVDMGHRLICSRSTRASGRMVMLHRKYL